MSDLGGGSLDAIGGSIIGLGVIGIIILAYSIAIIVPGLALVIRRIHDQGRRWYWILLVYAPMLLVVALTLISLISYEVAISIGAFLLFGSLPILIAQLVLIIVFMCQPTSPNAIGYSTHGDDGYGYGGYQGGGGPGGYQGGGGPGGYQAPGGYSAAAGVGNIIGLSGMYANVNFPIENYEEIVIGRDAALSHVVIDTNAEKISRKHVSIGYDPNERMYIVTDYSSNGTYLNNGTRLTPNTAVKLTPGSVIYLAKQENSFRLA
jgi:uncharacterized membrane protein YhaH (DUF805 family)